MERAVIIEWSTRIAVAMLAGAVIGLERQIRGKAAGLKTMILISMGACLYMITSEIVGVSKMLTGSINYVSDPARIAAQVVTGVGFLGAGVIVLSRDRVFGLTTAATIWVSASIGMIIGLGYELFGLSVAVFTVLILILLNLLEKTLLSRWYSSGNNRYKSGPKNLDQ